MGLPTVSLSQRTARLAVVGGQHQRVAATGANGRDGLRQRRQRRALRAAEVEGLHVFAQGQRLAHDHGIQPLGEGQGA